mgnify:FL=1
MRLDLLDDSRLEAERQYVPIKKSGTGSFGSVFVADWQSPLPSCTLLPAMQHSYTRPEYVGKRIVAIKKMKRSYKTLQDCLSLNELHALITIPPHENIILLYDVFRKPLTHELFLVFECMEGNLYQLIKSRRGRAMASGLIASITKQAVSGMAHIHAHGFLHRDMKPENLLITTTGLGDYPNPGSNAGTLKQDVLVLVKIADFGLARKVEKDSTLTTYVSTRWYRAPEILLRSRHYTPSVDVWAMGAIIAEMVRLHPIFPGANAMDQLQHIAHVFGTPPYDMNFNDMDEIWIKWLEQMKKLDHRAQARSFDVFKAFFANTTSYALMDMIFRMLHFDPAARITASECQQHPYLAQEASLLAPQHCLVPEPRPASSIAALSYDFDSPGDTDSTSSPACSNETQNGSPPQNELIAAPDMYNRHGMAHEDHHSAFLSKLNLLHRTHGMSRQRSGSSLFGSAYGRVKPGDALRSSGHMNGSLSSRDWNKSSHSFGERSSDSHSPERDNARTHSSSHFLQKVRRSSGEKDDAKQAERKRREDEKSLLRERSRAVMQHRASLLHEQSTSAGTKRWSDYGI